MIVLVVDDEPLIRLGVGSLLSELGHDVLDATSGTRALEKFDDNPKIDLLLTDFKMPGLSGLQLADRCRAIRPDLKVILMTGYSSQDHVFDEDCPVRLAKPFGIRSLNMAIEQVSQF